MSEVNEVNNGSTESSVNQLSLVTPDSETDNNFSTNAAFRYGFILGGYGFLIPEETESEVINSPSIFTIPNSSNFMAGIISVRGSFAPVFDLEKMLGIEPQSQIESVIVFKVDGEFLGFPFQSAHSLQLSPLASENNPELPETLTQFTENIYQTDQKNWIEFNFKSCMDEFANKISH